MGIGLYESVSYLDCLELQTGYSDAEMTTWSYVTMSTIYTSLVYDYSSVVCCIVLFSVSQLLTFYDNSDSYKYKNKA